MKNKNVVKKNLAPGEGNRAADGATVLGTGENPADHAHVTRMTPLQMKAREIANDPQYQADAIDKGREQTTTDKRVRRQTIKPLS